MESAASLRQKAAKYVQEEKYDLAIEEYEKVLQLEPSDASVYNHMGDIYLKKNEKDQAIDEYYRAVDVYVKEAYYTNAIAVCKKILRCDRDRADVYEQLGHLYAKQGLVGEAITNLMEFADRQMKQDNMDGVLQAYRTMVELTPENIDARKQLVEMYLSQEQVDEAVKELSEIADRLREQGKDSEVQAIVERIESIAPGAGAAVAAGEAPPEVTPPEAEVVAARAELGAGVEVAAPEEERAPEMVIPGEEEEAPAEAVPSEAAVAPEAVEVGAPEARAEPEVLPGEAVVELPEAPVGAEELAAGVVEELATVEEGAPAAVRPRIPEAADIEDWGECVEMGDLLLEIGSVDEAIDYFYRAATGYYDEGSFEESWRLFSKLAELRPFELRPRQKLVEIAVANEDAEAMVMAYLDLGECLMRRGATEEAESIYKRVIEIDPRSEEAIERLSVLVPDERFVPPEAVPRPEAVPVAEAAGPPEAIAPEVLAPEAPPEAAVPAGAEARPEAAPPPEAEPETAVPPSMEEFVDLGKALQQELAGEIAKADTGEARIEMSDEEGMLTLEQMIEEFKGGVWQHIDEGDYASHYDLGIAYREMGLVNEAISEFQIASRGKAEAIKSFEMLGTCFIDKGEIEIAIRQFERGLVVEGHREDEYIGLHYHLGRAYELQGKLEDALSHYENTYVIDIGFADVAEKVATLREAVSQGRARASAEGTEGPQPGAEPGAGAEESGEPAAGEPGDVTSREEGRPGERGDDTDKPKKDRISYV
ncbi:hypothetical protein AMJ39_04855 [candidate division TA06 bacterium DG_24]|uniref:Tetratricopeptide repeat protein n=2 Tax=Bacteria division TA06 TaxID=1156500 RepID=A0A0S8GAC0_UNCT6|nr:MAG: hypothetical protein AMJ39_04855 [candidate division TA06 bacterium DG_24]KPK68780.1 MAG: hypothetical protein AMJ82_07340 [candidate division TA06 bacterium SM23_40]